MDAGCVVTWCNEIEEQFVRLIEAHADLKDAIDNYYLEDIVGYGELEQKEMGE